MKRKIILIIAIFLNLLIWINSLMPATISKEQSGFFSNIFYPLFKNIVSYNDFSHLIRKLAHFSEFLLLGLLFSLVYKKYSFKKYYLITLIHGFLVAIIDEVIQIFIPGRAFQILDILIDTSGTIFGILITLIFVKIFNKTKVS